MNVENSNWVAIWKFAIGDPSPEKIETMLADPAATVERALRWVFLTGMVVTTGIVLIPLIFGLLLRDVEFTRIVSIAGIGFLVILPLGGVFITVSFLLNLSTIHFFAKLFGDDYSYWRLVYPMAAVLCPFALINLGLLYIPVLGWSLLIITTVYQLIVIILTIKGVYNCTWFQAIVIGIIPPAMLQMVFYCLYYLIYFTFLFESMNSQTYP